MNSGNDEASRLLRMKAAAARCGVSVRTLYRDIAEGKLRLSHIRGCACIKESDFEDYIKRSAPREQS